MYFIEGMFWSKVAVNFVSVLLAYNAPSICPSRFRWSWDTAAAVVLLLLFRVHIPSVDTYCVLGLNKAYYWLPTAYEYSSSDFTSRFDILPCVQDVYYWCVVIHPSVNRWCSAGGRWTVGRGWNIAWCGNRTKLIYSALPSAQQQ